MGVAGGAVLGHFHHKGLGLTAEDRTRIGAALTDGKAAVGILAEPAEVPIISDKLTELGGVAETHLMSDEALDAVAAAVPEAPAPLA